jgi:pyruvate-formate lyase-activating enzyme
MKSKTLDSLPSLVVSDSKGNLFDLPEYGLAVRQGDEIVVPGKKEIIALPEGSDLHVLPQRYPVAVDRNTGELVTLKTYRGIRLSAASAFMAPAHTALYLAAYERRSDAVRLPLFAYAPLGFDGTQFVTTAKRVDRDARQEAKNFDQAKIIRRGNALLEKYQHNRLTTHLIRDCAFTYLCPAARNWVMGRWEAPIPTSVACNSSCLGCISKQPGESGVPVTQERITFVPTVEEIIEYTVPHLEKAARPVVSFGQGCEGEPLTQAAVIEDAVREMRSRTKRGTINLNTNASFPKAVERICKAGLNSIRVSLNSAQEALYRKYYRPRGYAFDDVIESLRFAKKHGVWVSLNYLVFPGFTDSRAEMVALKHILREIPVDMIQMRNLNIDPDWYVETLGIGGEGEPVGILTWMKEMKKVRPTLRYGYFNPSLA